VTPFRDILRRAVQATPGAIGSSFADAEGEMVDYFADYDPNEWAILTAHYGVVFAQLHAAFGIFHFGAPEYFMVQHAKLGVVVHAVDGGYFALMAVKDPARLTFAVTALEASVPELRQEMA
jgi:predicted regulator of Ras-like GTPase activity (Roadblock/LC7/MglB family)